MISEREIASIRERLLDQQRELVMLRQTGDAAADVVELDQSRVGRLSRMDALQGQAMSQDRERRREHSLQEISAALSRIDSGDYGFCEACGEAIAVERLRLNLSARLCIDCASRAEQS
jgi:DnaK suppressor protein